LTWAAWAAANIIDGDGGRLNRVIGSRVELRRLGADRNQSVARAQCDGE